MARKPAKTKEEAPKKDTSPRVYQREKIKIDLKIRELDWTDKQLEFMELVCNKDTKAVFLTGPAGSSKTLISVRAGLQLLNERKLSDIIYLRSNVESSDSHVGFLPGSIDDKLQPYMTPLGDKLEEMLPKEQIQFLNGNGHISSIHVGFCRGLNWVARYVILDEAQNCTFKEIVTVLTRLGRYSKVIICADPAQSDLPSTKQHGFKRLCELFNSEEAREHGIHTFQFTDADIVRSELCAFIVKTIDAAKEKQEEYRPSPQR